MMANPSRDLSDLLDIQSGVISRQQATSAGLPPSAIDNKLRYGRWQRLQQGVYAAFTGTVDRQAQLWGVALRAGPKAALSYRTAAELYGLVPVAQPGGLIHVTVPVGYRTGLITGAAVHYTRSIETARHPALLPPRTRVEETVLDLTQISASFDEAFDWLCKAVGRRLTTPKLLQSTLESRPRMRWRADLVISLTDVADGARSPLERRYISAVERPHGLPKALRQAKITIGRRSRYLDNFYGEAQLAVELDGRAFHPPEQRWADSHRDNDHAGWGILTLRYSWADIVNRPCEVATQVADLLRRRGTAVELRRCGDGCVVRSEPK
jgi:very-short-patch-repair endonuclease